MPRTVTILHLEQNGFCHVRVSDDDDTEFEYSLNIPVALQTEAEILDFIGLNWPHVDLDKKRGAGIPEAVRDGIRGRPIDVSPRVPDNPGRANPPGGGGPP